MKIKLLALFVLFNVAFTAFSKNPKFKTGYWYASLILSESDHLPVMIEFQKEKKSTRLSIINGSERILLDDLEFQGDSIFIEFPAFDSEIRAKVHSKSHISGNWYNHAKKGNYYIPFWTKYKYADKYPVHTPSIDVTGKWEVTFDYDDNPYKSIGIFESNIQNGCVVKELTNRVTGTFLTETGDYRFLEGATIKDSLYLSTFDGSHAFLFKAQFRKDTLWGEFLSGNHYRSNWFALRNETFEIGHPDSLTTYSNASEINFSLPDLTGETYNFPKDADKNKVTLIQIMGTWCPNCLDESMYLKTLQNTHGDKLQIIAVTFETQKELTDKIKKVDTYRTNLELPYKFLIGGNACKSCATDLFPSLSKIISFPTLIFIDKQGEIRKVHTGFNGPGTGKYYDQFVSSTNSFVQQLINE